MQTRSDALCEVHSVVQKQQQRLCVCACVWVRVHVGAHGRGGDMLQTLQDIGKCEVCLGSWMESKDLQAMRLHGGRGHETGKGGYGYHG